MLVVVYSNTASLPGRILRRHWRRFFHWKAVYFNSENLRGMVERAGLRFVAAVGHEHVIHGDPRTRPRPSGHSEYPASRGARVSAPRLCARRRGRTCRSSSAETESEVSELLTVIVPVFNEAAYVRGVLDELLGQAVRRSRTRSSSSRATAPTVRARSCRATKGAPGSGIIYEDRPSGKGSAVRRGLKAATGTIVLIQDADFEYDLDDYDALLEPILQRRTSFVLGSRSLGLDDWKVRRFARSRVKAFLMNVAQLGFARIFNVLYQQRVTDVATMFKVFRARVHRGHRVRRRALQLRHRARVHDRHERLQPNGGPGQLRRARLRRG